MSDMHPHNGDPAVERQRGDLDRAQATERTKADSARFDRRLLADGTRQESLRGDRQSRQALGRQRAAEDESLRLERASADAARTLEHGLSDSTIAREKDAREGAEQEAGRCGDREASRTRELEEALRLIDAQWVVVSESLSAVLEGLPPGSVQGSVSERVKKVRTATERMHALLRNVVDPKSVPSRDDVPGGSG